MICGDEWWSDRQLERMETEARSQAGRSQKTGDGKWVVVACELNAGDLQTAGFGSTRPEEGTDWTGVVRQWWAGGQEITNAPKAYSRKGRGWGVWQLAANTSRIADQTGAAQQGESATHE